jgi:hypothetical protein
MPDDHKELVSLAGASASVADVKVLNLHQRLLLVMGEVTYIQKDRTIGSYMVVTHDAVTAKVRPSLVKHRVLYYPQNLHYVQNGNRTEVRTDIRFVNADVPTDYIEVPTLGFGVDQSDKGPGKALSYAVKMALLKALGLETGEDADDGSKVEHVPEPKSPAGISKVKIEVREAVREINGCDDAEQLLALLDTPDMKKLAVKVCRDFPQEWTGEEENSGLKGMVIKAGNECLAAPDVGNWLRKVEEASRGKQ